MACKSFRKWLIKDRFYVCIKVANELWSFSRRDESDETQTHLFFIGWYQIGNSLKLWTITLLNLSIQTILIFNKKNWLVKKVNEDEKFDNKLLLESAPEPSDTERAQWPIATLKYVEMLEEFVDGKELI